MANMTAKIAGGAVLWVVAAVGYLLLEAAAAASFKPVYSYTNNYISDLGVTGPRAYLMHTAFYLQGILFLLGALLIVSVPRSRPSRLFLGLVAANAIGNIVVGTVHYGKVHVVGAALAIVGGNIAVLVGSAVVGPVAAHRWYRSVSKLVAALGISCLIMLIINWMTMRAHVLPNGTWERGSVYSITMWQLLTAASLLIGPRHARDQH
ncbi:MAG: hypothetical protein QOH91_800 [Mycobacterium sp.]|jgi:hypothetical membrane protein|nr:hypothetical protein [Mycobacterium sp.]